MAIIYGTNGNDMGPMAMIGTTDADTIDGMAGHDHLHGLGGNDILVNRGVTGMDIIDGGAGTDLVSYAHLDRPVLVSLKDGVADDPAGIVSDKLISIENVWGSAYEDTLVGNAIANELIGRSGNDILEGMAGADVISGGTGKDLATYGTSYAGVTVSLATGEVHGGHAEGDKLYSIESLGGSDYADMLKGTDGANDLHGGKGNDSLYGQGDDDELLGGDGNDVIDGGFGADFAHGGKGSDTVFGGAGADRLEGNQGSDTIYGQMGRDLIDGGSGDDVIVGGSNDDTFLYNFRAPRQDTGDGHDRIVGFEGASKGWGDVLVFCDMEFGNIAVTEQEGRTLFSWMSPEGDENSIVVDAVGLVAGTDYVSASSLEYWYN
ncbi:calcium-binding protein [Arenibaculum pallidiluteum]|uniref:calcium-binding protein n=1 Tax=Arenibaculum pallidiluteum TaxID=2812559 RepID=UPI001A957E6E|nr:calcium-binding protein [Arenibaculum pallidiluteum]